MILISHSYPLLITIITFMISTWPWPSSPSQCHNQGASNTPFRWTWQWLLRHFLRIPLRPFSICFYMEIYCRDLSLWPWSSSIVLFRGYSFFYECCPDHCRHICYFCQALLLDCNFFMTICSPFWYTEHFPGSTRRQHFWDRLWPSFCSIIQPRPKAQRHWEHGLNLDRCLWGWGLWIGLYESSWWHLWHCCFYGGSFLDNSRHIDYWDLSSVFFSNIWWLL